MTTDKPDITALSCPHQTDAAAYLQGELTQSEKTAFEAHMGTCPVCRQSVKDLSAVIASLKNDQDKECKGNIANKVMSGLPGDAWNKKQESPVRHLAFTGWLKIAALFAIVAGICAISFINPHQPPEAPPEAVLPPETNVVPEHKQETGKNLVIDEPQPAVTKKALDWLKNAQQPDGSWSAEQAGGKDCFIGVTSLALLAFLENDDKAFSGPYAGTVRRGIDYLVGKQNESGLIGPEVSVAPYNHGMAALVIQKACAIESNTTWQTAGGKCIQFLCSTQLATGGWGYRLAASEDVTANNSASIWPLQALVYADSAGFEGLRPNIEKALSWLRSTITRDGYMGYTDSNQVQQGQETITAAGFVCFLKDSKWKNHPSARALVPALRKIAARTVEKPNFYRMFFVNEALKLAKDSQMTSQHPAALAELQSTQSSSGNNAGSWDADDSWGNIGGRVYSTSMAALTIGRMPAN